MTGQQVFETVKKNILNQLPIDGARVVESADLKEDLGADSANLMMLIMDLEDAFGMQVEDAAIADIKTVGDIVEYISARV